MKIDPKSGTNAIEKYKHFRKLIHEAAMEALGENEDRSKKEWWSEHVAELVARKKVAYNTFLSTRQQSEWISYRELNEEVKRAVNEEKICFGRDAANAMTAHWVTMRRRWTEADERRCELHWRDSRQQRRQELIPRARLRQRSPDYSKWEDPLRPLRHSVSFCGKLGQQYSQHQQSKQAGGKHSSEKRSQSNGSGSGERGFCTLRRESRRGGAERMERSEESNESGYDGGSQENILSEPIYEKVSRRGAKESKAVGKEEQGGHCKEDSGFEGNKVTIHAVIETVRNQPTHHDSSESDDLYEKIDEVRASKVEPSRQEEVFEKDPEDSHESNKEVVYSHVSIHRAMKKVETKEEKKVERKIVQELVKVAENEGSPSKIPTPPPFKNLEKSKDTTFVEEEYSYEPELKKSSSKLVLRTRSLLNLDEENKKSDRSYVRPAAVRMKITTGPDGTFVIDGRKATSELNLSDESRNGSPKEEKRISISGEDLKKRKEEIFKVKELPPKDENKYFDEINQNKPVTTKEEAIHNLKKYLKENNIGLKDLLTNNNVVIIDTYRDKKSIEDLSEYNHKTVRDCRITGTMAKGEAHESHTLPRANRVHQPVVQRHYFYNLFKHRPSPPDEELPDPDKVRSTRQMFQKSKEKVSALRIMMPIAAKIGNPKKEARPTPEVRLVYNSSHPSPRQWTDSGSVSSGVSSDMSQLDQLSDKCYSSEDEEAEPESPVIDTHPISPEVLEKIRECGTTITYYGGRVIAHSHGPGNPMTLTIMDEIRQGREGGCRGKFRLIKSNSCGSRLELAGTDDQQYHETSKNRFYEDVYGGTPLSEEMRGSLKTVLEEEFNYNNYKKEKSIRKDNNKKHGSAKNMTNWGQKNAENNNDMKPSWRELIESRKQKKAMEYNRRPCPDMVFEEFQVLES